MCNQAKWKFISLLTVACTLDDVYHSCLTSCFFSSQLGSYSSWLLLQKKKKKLHTPIKLKNHSAYSANGGELYAYPFSNHTFIQIKSCMSDGSQNKLVYYH